jgi:transcription factor SPT20
MVCLDYLQSGDRARTDEIYHAVPKETHILRKYKGCTPSLIVHLHPTHFRFDQQDGSFSYHSEMRVFIEHLAKGTIPHDMVEEFRKSEVKYYDGWLIVRVVDHKSAAKDAIASGAAADDEKPFSIHNYNQYITPSPYAPFPTKEQPGAKSPPLKQEQTDQKGGPPPEQPIDVAPRSYKPQPKIYHVALRPTILSRHMDLVIDAMQPDPKSLTRKGSQANVNGRAAGTGAPQTPISGMPPTPSAERGPPLKKQKLKIDPKDIVEYESRVVNATAPPLYLDPVESLEEAETLLHMLKDPLYDQRPPSPKSRKRTIAELAADDAQAKEQERFMLVMDERTAGTNGAANGGAGDGQTSAALFQPRFEKFNALDNIKREIAERKQREKDRQLQEDETRRGQQERMEEEKKRTMMQRTQEARLMRARQAEAAAAAAAAAQQQQPQAPQPVQRPPSSQVNGIPHNMRNQMMQGGSPIIRQGTPHMASSPVVTSAGQGGAPMAVSGSQQGHGSPPRPGSAVQHGHPSAPMTRGPSQQGPSRNGTPQIPHGTPAQRNATPIMRQNTPAQSVSHASPHGVTPQMMPAGMIPGMQAQMPNGVHRQQLNPQQMAELQRRHALQQQQQQQAAQQAAMQNGMVNGTPQISPAQMAQMQAQQVQAQANREAAIRQQQQQQAMQSQQGTPQTAHMSPNPSQNQKAYNQQVAEAMKAQMQSLQQGQNHGSPAPNHMTPQQQQAQMVHAQQQQQQRMMQAQGQMMGQGMQHPQQRVQMDSDAQRQQYQRFFQAYQQRFAAAAAAKYGGNPQMLQAHEVQQIKAQAQQMATQQMHKQRQLGGQMGGQMGQAQAQAMQQMQQLQARQQMAQQQGGGMPNGMMGMQNMQGGQVPPNMAQLLQQQQAQQMQQMQMQHAQQMMAQQQQQHHQQQQQQNMQFQQR